MHLRRKVGVWRLRAETAVDFLFRPLRVKIPSEAIALLEWYSRAARSRSEPMLGKRARTSDSSTNLK